MSPNNLKNTPKNFRYLLSLKEIKEIEKQNEIKFKTITTGNVINSAYSKKKNTYKVVSEHYPFIALKMQIFGSSVFFRVALDLNFCQTNLSLR